MPIKRSNIRAFKEIKVYTLRRLLKRLEKYGGSDNEAEEYRKLEGIFFGKNFNPFKLLDRGIVTAADVQEAINELEAADLIEIAGDNRIKLTVKGEVVANQIKDIQNLDEVDNNLLTGTISIKKVEVEQKKAQESVTKPVSEPIKKIKINYTCPNCGNEIFEPKNFCPKCGREINLEETSRCDSCGNLNELGSAFCVRCGKRLG